MILDLPEAVREYLRGVFAHVNDHVSTKLSLTPNVPEESLDIGFIDSMGAFAGPRLTTSGWYVKIATHFIGGLGHWGRYEIADIGLVFLFKRNGKVLGRKLVLLQSKRLYPANFDVEELDEFDGMLGLGKIIRSSKNEPPIFSNVDYQFNESCSYGAIKSGNEQCRRISDHFKATNVPVHYLLYNPLTIPWRVTYPLAEFLPDLPKREIGARVIATDTLDGALSGLSKGQSPTLADIFSVTSGQAGQSLEDFFANEVLLCHQGFQFGDDKDPGIRRLFARKSGPIFCIVEVSIEVSS